MTFIYATDYLYENVKEHDSESYVGKLTHTKSNRVESNNYYIDKTDPRLKRQIKNYEFPERKITKGVPIKFI